MSDSLHSKIYLECKYRKYWAILALFESIEDRAKKEGKIPVLSLKQAGKIDSLWVVRSSDIKEIATKMWH